eukprot:9481804-Pyramimonas_sp.AAC.1
MMLKKYVGDYGLDPDVRGLLVDFLRGGFTDWPPLRTVDSQAHVCGILIRNHVPLETSGEQAIGKK